VPLAGVHHGQSEGAAQRRRLRRGQPVEDLHDGPQERVQPAEGDVHLRLDAARAEHERVVGRLGRVLEDGGLADPRLPSQHERGALARAGAGQDAVDHVALAVAAEEGHPHSLPRDRPGDRGTAGPRASARGASPAGGGGSSVYASASRECECRGRAESWTGEECSARRRTSRHETPSLTSAGAPMMTAVATSTAWRMIP